MSNNDRQRIWITFKSPITINVKVAYNVLNRNFFFKLELLSNVRFEKHKNDTDFGQYRVSAYLGFFKLSEKSNSQSLFTFEIRSKVEHIWQ